MKIAIAVGHALKGMDRGAYGILSESKCTREVGNKVKAYLEKKGYDIVYCALDNSDSTCESLSYRVNKANLEKSDLYIEIHFNSGGENGTETYVLSKNNEAYKYAKEITNNISSLGYINRGVKEESFYVLKNSKAPAVLVECCFIDSEYDIKKYDANKIASMIVKGILKK